MVAHTCSRCGASGGGAYEVYSCNDVACRCGGTVRCLCILCALADLLEDTDEEPEELEEAV